MSYLRTLCLQEMTHIILFLLISRENTDLLYVAIKEATKHSIPEGSRTTCYQQDFILKN